MCFVYKGQDPIIAPHKQYMLALPLYPHLAIQVVATLDILGSLWHGGACDLLFSLSCDSASDCPYSLDYSNSDTQDFLFSLLVAQWQGGGAEVKQTCCWGGVALKLTCCFACLVKPCVSSAGLNPIGDNDKRPFISKGNNLSLCKSHYVQ